jgi:hypothetical protein
MPLKRAKLAIFETPAKIFRTDRKTPDLPQLPVKARRGAATD